MFCTMGRGLGEGGWGRQCRAVLWKLTWMGCCRQLLLEVSHSLWSPLGPTGVLDAVVLGGGEGGCVCIVLWKPCVDGCWRQLLLEASHSLWPQVGVQFSLGRGLGGVRRVGGSAGQYS
jgi:hypothetical protein